jgi:hypothetical protein
MHKTASVPAGHVIILYVASIEFHIYLAQLLLTVEVLSSADVRFFIYTKEKRNEQAVTSCTVKTHFL